MGDRTRTGHELYFCRVPSTFWASSKRVFVCPENQIDTHREQTPFWIISIITITTTTAAWLPFIHVSSQRWGHWHWGITKNGECIKEEPHTTPFLKLLHFNVSLQWMSLHAIFGKKTLLFWSDILPFSLVFLSNDLMIVRFDDMVTVIKHPLETRKKRLVFNELLLLTWIICSPLPLKN
jgi:hypothetical protein